LKIKKAGKRDVQNNLERLLPGAMAQLVIFQLPLRKFLLHNRNDTAVFFVLLRNFVFRINPNNQPIGSTWQITGRNLQLQRLHKVSVIFPTYINL